MLRYIKKINGVKDNLRSKGRAFIARNSCFKFTTAFGLTVAIIAGLCFSNSSVTAVSIVKISSPGYYNGLSSAFGYGATTATVTSTSLPPVTTSETISKFTIPWWGWLTVGLVSFLITVLVVWRKDFTKH